MQLQAFNDRPHGFGEKILKIRTQEQEETGTTDATDANWWTTIMQTRQPKKTGETT